MAKSLKFLMKKGTWQSIACLSAGYLLLRYDSTTV